MGDWLIIVCYIWLEVMQMCEKCDNSKDWKYCPHCGAELNQEPEPKEGMTQEEFDKIFLDMMKSASGMHWLDEHGTQSDVPTCRFELYDVDGTWLFDIDLNPASTHFWLSYRRIYEVFEEKYQLQFVDIQRLMHNQLNILFKMHNVTPLTCTDCR